MALLEILINARDQTAPAFQSARAGLNTVAATAGQTSGNLTALGAASGRTADRIGDLTSKIELQERDLGRLRALIDVAASRYGLLSTQAATAISRFDRTSDSIRRNRQELDRLNDQARQSTSGVAQLNTGLSGLQSTLGAIGIGVGLDQLGQFLISFGRESSDLALKADTIGTAYDAMTLKMGTSGELLLATLRQASRGTISDTQLMLSANKALGLGVGQNIEEVGALLAIARQKGKDFGVTTEEAFARIVEGLGKAEPEILDELGIIQDANKVYKEYARSIGVSVENLTKKQKITAQVNEVLRNNTDLVAKNAAAETDAADRIAAAETRKQEAKTRIGRAIQPAVIGGLEGTAGFLDFLTGQLTGADAQAGFRGVGGNAFNPSNPIGSIVSMVKLFAGAEGSAISRQQQSDTALVSTGQLQQPFGTNGGASNSSTQPQVVINIQGSVISEREYQEAAHRHLLEYQNRNGGTGIRP